MSPSASPETPLSARAALDAHLARCEAMHPVEIDMGLDRVAQVAQRLNGRWRAPVVTVAGTNGKGSSCALLEAIGLAAGYRVGVYSKPHLCHFEERCRVGGVPVSPADLLPHFEAVEAARGDVSLTYFEFTTLVILRALSQAELDLVVLEVGLGGRLDAVNVVDPDVALITSVAIDHTDYLGGTREAIGREKAGIMRRGRPAVITDPDPPSSLLAHALGLETDLWLLGRDFQFTGDRQQWKWQGRQRRYAGLAPPALRGSNQLLNASGVLAVFEALQDRLPITAQAVRTGLAQVNLPGRFQVLAGQPVVVLDVAHNPHAAAHLAHSLDQMGFYPRTRVVFGAMADKDIEGIFRPLAHLVDHWVMCDLPTPRAMTAEALKARWQDMGLKGPGPVQVDVAPSPQAGLALAKAAADSADRIVVFGSFYTVGGVMAQS